MKLYIYCIAAILLLSMGNMPPSWGAEKKKPVLSDNVMEQFIEDFPSLLRDLRTYSPEKALAFEAIIQEGALIQNIDAVRMELDRAQNDEGIKKIISKHGWDKNFTDVYITVMTAHSFIITENFFRAAADSGQNSLISKWMDAVHPDDIAIVRKNLSRLNDMIFSIDE